MTLAAYDSGNSSPMADRELHYAASLRDANKTASIRSRPSSQRMSGAEMEMLMRNQQQVSSKSLIFSNPRPIVIYVNDHQND